MPEFFNVQPPRFALEELLSRLKVDTRSECVSTAEALGRVTTRNIISSEELPAFPRSSMDGYSVRANDTFGATESLPAYLEVCGEVLMGAAPQVNVQPGYAAIAYTGGLLAKGTDAVVMIEHTNRVDDHTVEIVRPVAPGENVIQQGEDIGPNDTVLSKGCQIRPQDIGALMALGITKVAVAKRPRVAIVSTGDELVSPEMVPAPGQIRDINTYTIAAAVTRAGGVPVPIGLVKDDYDTQREAALTGLSNSEILVFSAGSSVSSRDMTAQVLDGIGKPGILTHGIAHKPGKPTVIALIDNKPAFGLPGNPVSAFVVFGILVRPTIHSLMGYKMPLRSSTVVARLSRNVSSTTGREDHVPVNLYEEGDVLTAEPVFGKSNLIYTLVRSDGVVVVPLNSGGLYSGDEVTVTLY